MVNKKLLIARCLCLTAFLTSAAAVGVFYGRYEQLHAAVAANAAFFHPKTGEIVYGVAETNAISVALCELHAGADKKAMEGCRK